MTYSATGPRTGAREAAILIVDDAPTNLDVLSATMQQQGYRTYVATSGERALEIAQRVQPDLVLLDIMLPGMDGLETCRRLKAHPATAPIAVIFMSARTEAEDVVAGFDLGAADYITKPLRMAEVCARVRAHLAARSGEAGRRQAEHLSSVVNSLDESLFIIEAGGRIQYANPACQRYLGYAPAELAGRMLGELIDAGAAEAYLDQFAASAQAANAGPQRGAREVLVRHRDGAQLAMDLSITPMHAAEPLFVALLHDITRHKQSETALQRAALLDPLTKIANRRHFDSVLEREWQRAIRNSQPLSLIVLDVDHFKQYNDSFGHAAGDLCLQQVAAALQTHALRPTDLAARYGGEEFVLLFAETELDGALVLAEAIRSHVAALALPNPRAPTCDWITVSVGVATLVPTQLDAIESLFVAADRAMYDAKAAGRNRVCAARGGTSWYALLDPVLP